jgi:glutamine amidotransferase
VSGCIVVDYGRGNLLSVTRAIEHCGTAPRLSDDAREIAAADRVVLPGVGAFGDAMAELRRRRLTDSILDYASTERPLLGICIGMQILFDRSEEFGLHDGLGLIPGAVAAIPPTGADGEPHKVPHIGWSEIAPPETGPSWEDTPLAGIDPGTRFYFVHSFTARPADPASRLADADYDGRTISAMVRRGPLFGCQFHPEKSGPSGLRVIENFLTRT